jgi:hypothetical protein
MRTAKATEARIKKGMELSGGIQKLLKSYPRGLTLYQLSKLYKSSPGAILGAIERIHNEISSKEVERGNKKIKLYFSKEVKEEPRHPGLIEISRDKIKSKIWKHNVVVYGISTDKIIISPKEQPSLKQFLNSVILLKENKDKIEFVLPQIFIDFYNLKNNEKSIEISPDSITINIAKQQSQILSIIKKKVLIVDDEHNQIIKNIRDILGKYHKVIAVENLKDAEEKIKDDKPDFLILDWTLKDSPKEHQKLLELLRKENKKSYGIIITAHAYEREEVSKEIRKGFSWFYSKFMPNLPREILTKMSEVFE